MSRVLWFFLGAGVSTWWLSKKNLNVNVDCQYQRRLGPAPSQAQPQMMNSSEQMPANYQPYQRDWEHERARVRQFSREAGDTFAELSEATLNTILQATEALKVKIAEQRALREEERRMEEERRRTPPRYV
ncbi:hypothetical protein C8F04DRAFT_1138175 [Mycena alexandri]|uniref:Uncharacterized protein n=1 Tax=Mycena alexandri TaxID=1745969 RepID=A0AAD6WRJ7_9AGAR|nr:hypothetical protein C8F04DRAFT_1140357 [Mycena alexandri]KAJ7022430.1 hypothetical protein C8F04DRAFT_1138175 [Mycena alexandri]